MNMEIGIRLKIDTKGLHQKCFSGGFSQLLELRLLKKAHRWLVPKYSFAEYLQSL